MRFYYSTTEKSHIYHEKSCRYRKQINYRNRRSQELTHLIIKGYKPCKYCFSCRYQYRSELPNLRYLTKDMNWKYELVGNEVYLKDGFNCWKMVYYADDNVFELFHGQSFERMDSFEDIIENEYQLESEAGRSKSLMGLFLYIRKKVESTVGYSLVLKNKLSQEKSKIEELVSGSGIDYDLFGKDVVITTAIGYWKIHYENYGNSFVLYHGNHYPSHANLQDYIKEKYHVQSLREISSENNTLIRYFKYIKDHDNYRIREMNRIENMPREKEEEREKYEKMKRKEMYFHRATLLREKGTQEEKEVEI